jgi:PKD repeat protein
VLKTLTILSLIILFTSCHREEVDVTINADFSYEVIDNDFSVPVKIAFTNKSTGGQTYKWTFEGGSPETYTQKDPGYIIFSKPGTIKIKLEVGRDNEHKEKEITIQLDSVVKADFDITPVINNYGATEFKITNKSAGTTKYNWTFEGGTPAASTEKAPSVNYTTAGEYAVKLEATNERGEKNILSKTIKVLRALSTPDFDIAPSFEDDDYEAPLTAKLENHTTSSTIHKWAATGGSLSNASDSLPSVTFTNPGTYTITYEASNGKQTATVSKNITIKPNSGLRTFINVQLGINTAHATIGSFFSTSLRKVIKQSEVTDAISSKIDLVFFGLSESFSYNLFASPNAAATWTFPTITGATQTKIINKQESCGCNTSFTATDFDNATTGSALDGLSIVPTTAGSAEFNNSTVPRVILFQNTARKKGAIKIKQFIQAGQQSYILCDIKVQKD